MIAFTDLNGGYYQVDAPEGFVPEWAKNMTSCEVIPTPTSDPKDAIRAQIRALEQTYADAQAKLTRQSLLTLALDKFCADPAAVGLTRDQVHELLMAAGGGYAQLFNLEQTVAALRAQL
jgi:hypothetical protein